MGPCEGDWTNWTCEDVAMGCVAQAMQTAAHVSKAACPA